MNKFSLYIHVPFCKEKCYYCDFSSFAHKEDRIQDYFLALETQIEKESVYYKNRVIDTIFIGGGTPSFVNGKYIFRILECVKNNFCLDDNAEITIEANPKTVDRDKLSFYKESGINRISLGVQAVQDRILRMLGRIHTFEDAKESIALIKRAGFRNFNVDTMFALEGQSIGDWEETLAQVVSMYPTHISTYALIVEEGTPFYKKYHGENPVDEDTDRTMYHFAQEYLTENGYTQYEISNFAKEGYSCRHNLYCWEYEEYIGFGTAAHSFVNGNRFSVITDIDEYINKIKNGQCIYSQFYKEQKQEQIENAIMLALRKTDGININEFNKRFQIDFCKKYKMQNEKFLDENLLSMKDGRMFLTK